MNDKKELSIVIVNYKNYNLTIKCIESVIKTVNNVNYEIIVIDNDSPNESYKSIKERFNDIITVIKNKSNEGFGAANNLGVRHSNGEYILFLNPDIIVVEDAIERMLTKIKSDTEIGLVSGKLLNDDYTIQYSCRRVLPIGKFLVSRTPMSIVVCKSTKEKINDYYLMKDYDHEYENEVDWVMGACMIIRKDLFIQVGQFSKEYFMYFEDVDLCCKLRKLNKKVLYLPEVKLIHLHQQESTKKLSKMTLVHLNSMSKFYWKYYAKGLRIKK